MKRRIIIGTLLLLFVSPLVADLPLLGREKTAPTPTTADLCKHLYDALCPDGSICYAAFKEAYHGYQNIKNKEREVLTLIDFSLPSTTPRLYVFDMKALKLLFKSEVAHGRNSGDNYATSFSNKPGSYKSSLGFFLTGNTYQGKNGYSLKLKGLERGINDNAEARAIVVHGAKYANPTVCKRGRLGRSLGCPALPEAMNKPIIDAIKGGSVLYIYATDQRYRSQTHLLPNG